MSYLFLFVFCPSSWLLEDIQFIIITLIHEKEETAYTL